MARETRSASRAEPLSACLLLAAHPDVRVGFIIDAALTDIVAERYDAGVRLPKLDFKREEVSNAADRAFGGGFFGVLPIDENCSTDRSSGGVLLNQTTYLH